MDDYKVEEFNNINKTQIINITITIIISGFTHCLYPLQTKGDAYGGLVVRLRAFAGSPVLLWVRFIGSSVDCPPARGGAQSSPGLSSHFAAVV